MSKREVLDCDRCGVHDIPQRKLGIPIRTDEGVIAMKSLDLCTECAALAFEFVAASVDPEMSASLLKEIAVRHYKGDFEPF